MHRSSFWSIVSLAAAMSAASPECSAVLLPLNGTWLTGDENPSTLLFEQSWIVDSPHPVELCVTDVYISGDTFDVFVGGKFLGAVLGYNESNDGNVWVFDGEEAMKDGAFSYARWLLEPGEHEITVRTTRRPRGYSNDAGGIAFRAMERPTSVPETGRSLPLLAGSIAGMAGMAGWRSRRKQPA